MALPYLIGLVFLNVQKQQKIPWIDKETQKEILKKGTVCDVCMISFLYKMNGLLGLLVIVFSLRFVFSGRETCEPVYAGDLFLYFTFVYYVRCILCALPPPLLNL